MKAAERHHDTTWPYDDLPTEDTVDSEPLWACKAGVCVCHPPDDAETPPEKFSILLCDEQAARMPGARCRVFSQGMLLNEGAPYADGAGWITVEARRLPEQVMVEWAPPDTPSDPRYPFRKLYYVDLRRAERSEAAKRRLHNLGYSGWLTLEDNIRDLQRAYDQPATGRLDDVEAELVAYHDAGAIPPRGAEPSVASPGFERDSFADRVVAAKQPPKASAPGAPPSTEAGVVSNPKVKNRLLVVRWPNYGSEFLMDNIAGKSAHVVIVEADGHALDAAAKDGAAVNDHWEITYAIPKRAKVVDVRASFRPTFGTKSPVDDEKKDDVDKRYRPALPVFESSQRYVVDDSLSTKAVVLIERDGINPRTSRRVMDGLMTVHNQQVSPLKPAVQITLLTQFVDVTEIFKRYATLLTSDVYEDTYEASVEAIDPGGKPWTALRILGSTAPRTSGPALLWFTFCPGKVREDAALKKLDCLLLCRHETHVRLPSIRTLNLTTSWLNKFLFDRRIARRYRETKTGPLLTESFPGIPLMPNATAMAFKQRYMLFLGAGFGRSMAKSGRNVSMLCPIPDHDSSRYMFGPDASATVAQAIRYLWARDGIVRDPTVMSPPKPKLMAVGFSSGGNALFSLLEDKKMSGDLSAVMSMDTIINEKNPKEVALARIGQVMAWLDGDKTRRFFMIVGQNGGWTQAGTGELERFVNGAAFKKYNGSDPSKPRQLHVFPTEDRRYEFYYPGPPSANNKVGPIWYATVTRTMPKDEPAWDLVKKPAKGPRRLKVSKNDSEGNDELEAHHGWAFHGGPDDGTEKDPDKVNTLDYESFLNRFFKVIA